MTLIELAGCLSSKKNARKALARVECMRPFDAIIVPGVPFKNNAWDSTMKARVLWSYILYKNGYTRNVIYSGSAVYTAYYESMIMGLYAEQLGIPREHIFYEKRADHSTENIYYSYLLAREHGFRSIALATDPFQSAMLKSFTRKRFGTTIYHLPFNTDSLAVYNHIDPRIDPTPARAKDFVSIKDRETLWQRLGGTMGKNIIWSQFPNGMLPPL